MIRKIIRNKSNLFIIVCITISSVLLISIGIIFSSFRNYLVDKVESEIGSYHVIIKGSKVKGSYILNNNYNNDRNYIRYKEVGRVYKNTKDICRRYKCLSVTYNDSLLSLYGKSRNKNVLSVLKSFLYFFIVFFGVIVFFIIYNSYSISMGIRKREIVLYKLVSADDNYLYKLYFKESFVMGIIGILFGLIISVFINLFFIKLINNLLYEIFLGKFKISVYFSFIIIPILFLFLIIFACSFFSLKKIRKYKALELFRDNYKVYGEGMSLNSNFIIYFLKVNLNRFRDKYKSLIICIFVFCFSFNVIFLVLNYGLTCISKYVIIPEYDLSISVKGDYDFERIKKDFGVFKKNEFHSCQVNVNIPKDYFNVILEKNSPVILTDLGGNEVINTYEVIEKKNRISHLRYSRFIKFDKLVIDDIEITGLKLSDKKFFGLDSKDTVINLEKDEFKKVCDLYNSNLIIKTDYKGIDHYLNSLIRKEKINMNYLNVKKTKELINNLVLVLKLFVYGVSLLVLVCLICVSINVSIFSIYERRKEMFSYRSLGLCHKDLIFVLFLECLYVEFKGFILSVPFIFIINKYFYTSIKKVFDFSGIIVGYGNMVFSFIISFFFFFISMFICLHFVNQKSLISNIKYNY